MVFGNLLGRTADAVYALTEIRRRCGKIVEVTDIVVWKECLKGEGG